MEEIDRVIELLKKGEVIIYPTESCYGFGCDAKNKEAVEKIHKIKEEPLDKPVTIITSDLEQMKEFGEINDKITKLSKEFMPGQLNLVINKNDKYPHLSKEGISFRIPNHPIALEIPKKLGSAITTTSVNIHNQPSIYKIEDVKKLFQNKVTHIIDGGDLNEETPTSTIFDTRNNKVLREGIITEEQILEALK